VLQWFWRIGETGVHDGYPVLISRFWYDLPSDLERVDAIYEREDNKFALFSGE
jgi:hypothetical protein